MITGFRTATYFSNCDFIGNSAMIGNYVVLLSHGIGGAANLSAIDSTLSFDDCKFIGNSAIGGYGGVFSLITGD